jgi:hypothetical protein
MGAARATLQELVENKIKDALGSVNAL